MPYEIRGTDLYHEVEGRMVLKSHHPSKRMAEIVKARLEALDSGKIKTFTQGWRKK